MHSILDKCPNLVDRWAFASVLAPFIPVFKDVFEIYERILRFSACNLYYRKNGRKRPANLQKRGIMKRNRRPRLPYGQQIAEAHLAAQAQGTPAPATVQLLDAGVVSQGVEMVSSSYFEY